ncbi:hypothetical protein K2173_000430 [Erythroxylum novogranatense]|uniref:Histidine-containing phosphotransfer protein n=1 Tax=Erythroxylum novogranatense TaxID=1862640 RepID=A0AAV8SXF5_9ROSI|nr:hypothetical protein K2173_000430 [Erythroxylum novogranatense]
MDRSSLHQQISTLRQSLLDEGILDQRFTQLENLETKDNPDFVEDIFDLYFRDSTRYIASIEQSLQQTPVDSFKLDKTLYRLKGSSASVGAIKIKREVNQMRAYCEEGNLDRAKESFELLKLEHSTFRDKLEPYLEVCSSLFLNMHARNV